MKIFISGSQPPVESVLSNDLDQDLNNSAGAIKNESASSFLCVNNVTLKTDDNVYYYGLLISAPADSSHIIVLQEPEHLNSVRCFEGHQVIVYPEHGPRISFNGKQLQLFSTNMQLVLKSITGVRWCRRADRVFPIGG